MYSLVKLLVIGLFLTSIAGLAYADGVDVTDTGALPVTATMGDILHFSWELYDQTGNAEFSWSAPHGYDAMAFGSLQQDPVSKNYFSEKWFALILYTAANMPYDINQTSDSLDDGAGHDLDDTFVVTPDYKMTDKWGTGDEQGSKGADTIDSATLVQYVSNPVYGGNEGKGHIIRFYYALPEYSTVSGFSPIPEHQTPGSYTGSVMVSMVAQ